MTLGGRVRKKLGAVATTYPNGLSSTFVYDDLNRLKSVNGYQYQLGPTGNRQSATEPNGRTLNWTYDGIYRLANETITGGSVNGAVSYSLDPVGNRLSQNSTLSGIGTASATFDANDRLSTEQYDNNGNTIQSGARTFAYDSDDQLKSMNGTAVTIVYNGDGDRVAKTVGGVTTQYLVDDLNPTGYAQVVEEATNGAVTRRYTYGLQRISQEQVTNGSWVPSFYGYDGFDTVRGLSDASGVVTDTYDYDAWGNTVNSTGSTPNVYLSRGEQYDPDLNLYYLRARYLNPLTGRFLTRDPDEGVLAEPMTLQKYVYAADDPIDQIDPTGWQAQSSGGCNGAITPEAGGYLHFSIGPLLFPQVALPAPPPAPWSKCNCCDPTDARVLREMACLFKAANWGWDPREQSSWMMKGTCGLQRWPWSAENAKATWKGPVPQDACAIVHTHPKKSPGGGSMDPMPSSGDQGTANRLGKCNYVLSQDGIWVGIPNSPPERVASATWWKPYEKTDCGDGKKPKPPKKPKKPKAPRGL